MTDRSDRTPAWLRQHGNRLAAEPSLYLRQHAHNPVDWYPWGDEALARARDEDKPIFLSVGYSSCHWCHVMEHEVFEDDETAAFLNGHYVSIKIDREERPDLDQVYMDAVNLLTGRGGWPMSVFLTPEGKPFHGGTYYPRPHFLELVQQIARIWREDRAGVERQASAVGARIAGGPGAVFGLEKLEPGAFRAAWIDGALERLAQIYDEENGGFLQQQKFPTPVKWRFLLRVQRRRGDAALARRIARTCEAMVGGGLRDQLGGGFHRYTVDPDWTVPHFEKMLYDNGQIISLLLEAGAALERPDFTAAACDGLDFLLREMRSPEGAFYASFDADSGGEEGSYYVWSRGEIIAAAGQEDGPALADVLGVDEVGNFENSGRSVLTQRADQAEIAERYGRDGQVIASLFAGYRDILRARRAERTPPALDRKVVTSWNALVISALAQASATTSQREYLDAARRAADHLLREHRTADGGLWRASTDGAPRGQGILDDFAFLADALLDLFQVGGDWDHLAAARELVDRALEEFGARDGGYYLSGRDAEAPLGRATDVFDSVEPSGAAALVQALIRLSALTGETKYRERASLDLEAHSSLLERAGLEMAWWLDAGLKLTEPLHEVVIAGDPQWPSTAELHRAALAPLASNVVVCRVAASGPDERQRALAPALAGKTAPDGRARAYVCEFGRCDEPTDEVEELKKRIDPAAAS